MVSNEETEGCGEAEQEEGELSPSRNLEENNFSLSANADTKVARTPCDPSPKENGGEEICSEKEGVEIDANGEVENGNVSETESGNGEGENGGHDRKSESEGEAPYSDSLRLSFKPLNVKAPMELQDKKRNSCVFYGNDSFYLLFALHKVRCHYG